MQSLLFQTLSFIIALDLFALVVLVLFLVNARINIKRKILATRNYIHVFDITHTAESSQEAATRLDIPVEQYINYCKGRGIELPEGRFEREEKKQQKKDVEQQRILEEEAKWRAEQERVAEERHHAQEDEARKRKDRLRKFGFRDSR